MKKILYTTTALAAVGMLALAPSDAMAQKKKASKPKITIGGYFQHNIGWTENSSSYEEAINVGLNTFHHNQESELYFKSKTKLDNGITVSTVIEFETDQSNAVTQPIDAAYATIQGSFGKLEVGNTQRAGFKQVVRNAVAPASGILTNSNPDQFDYFRRPGGVTVSPSTAGMTGNAQGTTSGQGFSYYTPSIGGFVAAISWAPDFLESDPVSGSGLAGGTARQQIDYSLSYSGKFGDVGIKAAGVVWNVMGRAGKTDENGWSAGANLSYGGFTFGGNVTGIDDDDSENTGETTTVNSADKDHWQIGLKYKTGPWTVAGNYYDTKMDGLNTDPDQDEMTQWGIQGSYALAPGIRLGATLNFFDHDDEKYNNNTPGNVNNGWFLATGFEIKF